MSRKKAAVYLTITGLNHYYGASFLEPGMIVKLKKEPANPYDSEAIKAKMPGLGKIGYVANSPYTVKGKSWSAGRIYDCIGRKARCEVLYVMENCIVCRLDPQSIKVKPCSMEPASSDAPAADCMDPV